MAINKKRLQDVSTSSSLVPSENFSVDIWSGDGGSNRNIPTGFNLSSNGGLVWIKKRTGSGGKDNILQDSVFGVTNFRYSNELLADTANGGSTHNQLKTFDSDGFSVAQSASTNASGSTYVAWSFLGGGAASTNDTGSIDSQVSANQAAGFSIIKWTGNQTNGSIGHGLSSSPEILFVKDTDNGFNWYVFTKPAGASDNLRFEGLNTTTAATTQNSQFTTTSTLIENLTTLASLNTTGADMLCYAFHSVAGYSKIGTYTGTGTTTGNFEETGFEPAFVLIKKTGSGFWCILDNKRNTSNPRNSVLYANVSNLESTAQAINFFTTGFQPVTTDSDVNASATYVYMAFAADPDTTTPTLSPSFDVATYTGNGTNQNINAGFKPDFVWIKSRSEAGHHSLFDTLRGTSMVLASNQAGAEIDRQSNQAGVSAFLDNGFTVNDPGGSGENYYVNQSGVTYVAWSWKMLDNNNDNPELNEVGTIDSLVSLNSLAGQSITTYTGNGTQNATVGNGFNTQAKLVIIKNRDQGDAWFVGSPEFGTNGFVELNEFTPIVNNNAALNYTINATTMQFTGTTPHHMFNASGERYVMYSFHNITGYQKIGKYTGDSPNAVTINIGFNADFVIIKNLSTNDFWNIFDTVRNPSDNRGKILFADTDEVEANVGTNFIQINNNNIVTNPGTVNNIDNDEYLFWAIKIN